MYKNNDNFLYFSYCIIIIVVVFVASLLFLVNPTDSTFSVLAHLSTNHTTCIWNFQVLHGTTYVFSVGSLYANTCAYGHNHDTIN